MVDRFLAISLSKDIRQPYPFYEINCDITDFQYFNTVLAIAIFIDPGILLDKFRNFRF